MVNKRIPVIARSHHSYREFVSRKNPNHFTYVALTDSFRGFRGAVIVLGDALVGKDIRAIEQLYSDARCGIISIINVGY